MKRRQITAPRKKDCGPLTTLKKIDFGPCTTIKKNDCGPRTTIKNIYLLANAPNLKNLLDKKNCFCPLFTPLQFGFAPMFPFKSIIYFHLNTFKIAYTVILLKASVGKVVYIMAYMQTSYCKIQHK